MENLVDAKLTLVSVNGRAVFMYLPYDPDGRCRLNVSEIMELFGIGRGECISLR